MRTVLAVAAGIVLLTGWLYALLGALFFVLLAGQVPDATAPEADPCCSPPDTWGQTAEGVVWALGAVALVTALGALALWAVLRIAGARPRARRFVRAPLLALLATAAGLAIALAVQADDARPASDGAVWTAPGG